MTVTKTNETVRLNLTLDTEFFELLKDKADSEYLLVGQWVRRYLMKNILSADNNTYSKCTTQNETNM